MSVKVEFWARYIGEPGEQLLSVVHTVAVPREGDWITLHEDYSSNIVKETNFMVQHNTWRVYVRMQRSSAAELHELIQST
jgi:hypothetical protein